MKKKIVKGILLVSALMMLGGTVLQPATARHINDRGGHRGGHHCGKHPGERHSREFYRERAEAAGTTVGKQRQQHRHHHHKCKIYPPA